MAGRIEPGATWQLPLSLRLAPLGPRSSNVKAERLMPGHLVPHPLSLRGLAASLMTTGPHIPPLAQAQQALALGPTTHTQWGATIHAWGEAGGIPQRKLSLPEAAALGALTA